MKSKTGCFNAGFAFSMLLMALLMLQTSCRSRKDFAYFQGEAKNERVPEYKQFIWQDDLLAIQVTSTEPELSGPFNPYTGLSGTQPAGYVNGIASPFGYLVDASGDISFPYLGQVKAAGKTREELSLLIQEKLSVYLKNPLVYIRILNFKVTVLGDVGNPGTFNIPNEKITLPEALGLAGDLNVTGLRKNVLLIRSAGGKSIQYNIDLTSKDLFSSPVYYLQQGDVIYVEANHAQRNSSAINNRIGIVISVATLFITTLTLVFK
jgi:polysaccharide export outer membrane protein